MERRVTKGNIKLTIKTFIRPSVEVPKLHQTIQNSHKCKQLCYLGSPHIKWTPNCFWKHKNMWNITLMANSHERIIHHGLLPQDLATLLREKWNGVDAILVVVIWFCKLAKMVPTKTITTFDSMKLFLDIWVIHHWIFQFIIDDRNAKFMVGSYKHLF